MQIFDYKQVKNPEYFSDGCIPAHSDHRYFETLQEYRAGKMGMRVSLNGMWKFSYAENYEKSVKGFESMDYDCREWEEIQVPAHIQMEGYSVPAYVNTQYPWDGHEAIVPGEIPTEFNPTAEYVKYFEVPEKMKNRPVYISFQGVESAFVLWCNGQYIGYSEDSFTPSEFDLSDYIIDGENKLAVQVFQWSAGSWMEDQDFYRFSGIFRDVYLYTIPSIHVFDVKAVPLLNDKMDCGTLNMTLNLTGEQVGKVQLILTSEGKEAARKEKTVSGQIVQMTVEVSNPKLWSAEIPNRYCVMIQIYDKKNQLCEIVEQYIGFRQFELKDGLMQLNGKRIVFHGTNRHEFCCDTGRVISRELMEQDIVIMKRNNINALRTSHYPNQSLLYDLCDEYGIYVIDETNLETHGLWDACWTGKIDISDMVPGNKPEWKGAAMKRAENMYERDKNHPSILLWSCGNESMGGKTLYEMSNYFRKQDSTRLVHYEGVHADRRYNETSDIESQMYTSVEEIEKYLKSDRSKPFICCEYMHSMGNANGAVHKYVELSERDPLFQGGFIWDFVDQAIRKKDRYGKEEYAYGGDFDEHPCDYNFCGNGIVYADRRLSPKMQEIKKIYQNLKIMVDSQQITIKNKYLFQDTSDLYCMISLHRDGVLIKSEKMEVDVPPMETRVYPVPFARETAPGEYVITVSFLLKADTKYAKKGYEIAFGQGIYENVEEKEQIEDTFTVIDGICNIGVKGKKFEALFDRRKYGLVSYRYEGTEMLKTSPSPNFWRAPVDDDIGNHMMMKYSQWKTASLYNSCFEPEKGREGDNPTFEIKENHVVIDYTYYLPTTPASKCHLSYSVFGNGWIDVKLSYDPVKELGDMPEFGVMFKMDADYENLEWYGNGPEETYCDRQMGAKLGIYHNKVQDNMASYLMPQECGNKTEVRYAKITDSCGKGLLLRGKNMNFSALPYTPHELENAMHPNELPRVLYTVVRVSLKQMGVGGDDAWGAKTHPEYLLNVEKPLEFTFGFCGIDKKQ